MMGETSARTAAECEAMETALRSIVDMIEDAIDTKVRTGRMPNMPRLIGTIRDVADAALAE